MALTIIVTDAGRAALVNAANTGTAPVTIAEVGLSATAVAPSAAAMALPGEFKRLATLSGDVVADDTIHLIVRDEGSDVFTVRSMALYLADGTLFAIYGQADVLVEKSAQAMMLIAIDVQFPDIDAATLTFGDANFLNPPATTTTQGVVELATTAEAQAGIDALRALTPSSAKAAILGWLLAQDGAGSGIDADMLDGQQGSYYADIPGRLGFSPVNKAGDTMTGLLTLSGDPTATGHATRKSYVDALVAAAALLAKLVTVDGAGSGLDADMLDGQQGSYYIDIPARLGFNPLNAALYTAADVRGKLITVDGSGSGVDADMLDGEHGSYYRDLTNSTGTLPNARLSGLYTGINISLTGSLWWKNGTAGLDLNNSDIAGVNGIFFQDSADFDEEGLMFLKAGAATGSQNMADYDCFRGLNGTLYWAGDKIWTAGNDGSGSGMDADMLDGQHGSYYRDLVNSTGILPNARFSGSYSGVTEIEMSRVRLTSTGDVSLSSTSHAFQIGSDAGQNIAADGNEIQARSNGSAADLHLNLEGGDVIMGTGSGKAWHSANDGAGSGLDADMLDGFQGSAYDRIVSSSIGQNGHVVYASGKKEIWGRVTVAKDSYASVTFPFTFDTVPVVTFPTAGGGGDNGFDQNVTLHSFSTTGFTIWQAGDTLSTVIPYHVIGK